MVCVFVYASNWEGWVWVDISFVRGGAGVGGCISTERRVCVFLSSTRGQKECSAPSFLMK